MDNSTEHEVFDLDAYEDAMSAEVRIKNPITGAPTPMVVILAGPEHADRKRLNFARQRAQRASIAKTGRAIVSDPEEDEADDLEYMVICTLGWRGANVPYSPAEARRLYADPSKRWLRTQVGAALLERELFTRACAPR